MRTLRNLCPFPSMWLSCTIINIASAYNLGWRFELWDALLGFMPETRVFLYIFKLVIEGGCLLNPAKGITLMLNNLHLRSTKLFIRVDRFTILFNIWIPDLHDCLRSLSSSSWAVGFTGVLFAYKIELGPYGFYWFDITHHRIWEK